MECLGPQCASMLLEWLKARAGTAEDVCRRRRGHGKPPGPALEGRPVQRGSAGHHLGRGARRCDRAPAVRGLPAIPEPVDPRRTDAARQHDRERPVQDRPLPRSGSIPPSAQRESAEVDALRQAIRDGRERTERLRHQARRAELKLAQLTSLSPETFEEFVAELFEALGYEVEQIGGTGDEGADLRLRRKDLLAIVQCKYHKRSVVGSPELQKFLGTIHHTRSHKGFFVTTSTFSLAAEKFVADHPIELVDGPRLVELVQEALGPGARREPQPAWF